MRDIAPSVVSKTLRVRTIVLSGQWLANGATRFRATASCRQSTNMVVVVIAIERVVHVWPIGQITRKDHAARVLIVVVIRIAVAQHAGSIPWLQSRRFFTGSIYLNPIFSSQGLTL